MSFRKDDSKIISVGLFIIMLCFDEEDDAVLFKMCW